MRAVDLVFGTAKAHLLAHVRRYTHTLTWAEIVKL